MLARPDRTVTLVLAPERSAVFGSNRTRPEALGEKRDCLVGEREVGRGIRGGSRIKKSATQRQQRQQQQRQRSNADADAGWLLHVRLRSVPRRGSPYGPEYERARRRLLASRPRCVLRLRCNGALASTADHDPPLGLHNHVQGSGCCVLRPACPACQHWQGKQVARLVRLRSERVVRQSPAPSRKW